MRVTVHSEQEPGHNIALGKDRIIHQNSQVSQILTPKVPSYTKKALASPGIISQPFWIMLAAADLRVLLRAN